MIERRESETRTKLTREHVCVTDPTSQGLASLGVDPANMQVPHIHGWKFAAHLATSQPIDGSF